MMDLIFSIGLISAEAEGYTIKLYPVRAYECLGDPGLCRNDSGMSYINLMTSGTMIVPTSLFPMMPTHNMATPHCFRRSKRL